MEKYGAIDVMWYLFTPEAMRRWWAEEAHPEIRKLVRWWKLEERAKKGYTIEEMVAEMDEAGVDKVCIPQVKLRSYLKGDMIWDLTLEEVYEVVKTNPQRFIGFAGFNPLKRMEAVREVERAVKEYGFKGVYIHSYGFGLPLNHRLFYPLYEKCAELGIAVSAQVGHSAESMPSELARPILLDDVALDFPELNIIGSHTGWPWVEEMIAIAWKHENVYVDISAHFPRYLDPSIIRFMTTRGQDKVLYGTNGPVLMDHIFSLKQFNELEMKEEVRRKILRENALKVLKP